MQSVLRDASDIFEEEENYTPSKEKQEEFSKLFEREKTSKSDTQIIAKNEEVIAEKTLPRISPDMLPNEVGKWVQDVCDRIESPFEIGVVNALSLIGNLIGNRVAIKPKANDYNYLEYPNIWGMVIGSPSIKKTPVFNEISKSVNRLQAKEAKKYSEDMKQFNDDMEIYTIKKSEFQKQLKKAKEGEELTFNLEPPERPKRVIHFTQDATIEAIAKIINDNPKGLLVLRDELSGFLKNLDSAGKEEYRSFYLEGWSSGSKSIDRAGNGNLYIPKLTLGVLGNIQPSIIKPYVYESIKGKKADGLLQRFQLLIYAEPIEIIGVDRVPNKTARDDFDGVIKYILENEEFEGTTQNDYNKQPFYSYSDEAQTAYTSWYINNDKEARQSENEALESHLAKYPKLINSLALIFHICELSKGYDRQGDYDISLENFQRALNLTNILKEHAKKLYSTFEVEEQHKEDMYNKIEKKIVELHNTSQLPMSYGAISQLVAGANAKDVQQVARDVAVTKGRKVFKIQ
ncbi:MAG: YfjI family protein [Desulfuromonadaceae bacterium]|nr:YfjI family protein [Desulfuromonadaceae bacterium]